MNNSWYVLEWPTDEPGKSAYGAMALERGEEELKELVEAGVFIEGIHILEGPLSEAEAIEKSKGLADEGAVPGEVRFYRSEAPEN